MAVVTVVVEVFEKASLGMRAYLPSTRMSLQDGQQTFHGE